MPRFPRSVATAGLTAAAALSFLTPAQAQEKEPECVCPPTAYDLESPVTGFSVTRVTDEHGAVYVGDVRIAPRGAWQQAMPFATEDGEIVMRNTTPATIVRSQDIQNTTQAVPGDFNVDDATMIIHGRGAPNADYRFHLDTDIRTFLEEQGVQWQTAPTREGNELRWEVDAEKLYDALGNLETYQQFSAPGLDGTARLLPVVMLRYDDDGDQKADGGWYGQLILTDDQAETRSKPDPDKGETHEESIPPESEKLPGKERPKAQKDSLKTEQDVPYRILVGGFGSFAPIGEDIANKNRPEVEAGGKPYGFGGVFIFNSPKGNILIYGSREAGTATHSIPGGSTPVEFDVTHTGLHAYASKTLGKVSIEADLDHDKSSTSNAGQGGHQGVSNNDDWQSYTSIRGGGRLGPVALGAAKLGQRSEEGRFETSDNDLGGYAGLRFNGPANGGLDVTLTDNAKEFRGWVLTDFELTGDIRLLLGADATYRDAQASDERADAAIDSRRVSAYVGLAFQSVKKGWKRVKGAFERR